MPFPSCCISTPLSPRRSAGAADPFLAGITLDLGRALWNEKLDRLRHIIDLVGVMGTTEAASAQRSAAASDRAEGSVRRF